MLPVIRRPEVILARWPPSLAHRTHPSLQAFLSALFHPSFFSK